MRNALLLAVILQSFVADSVWAQVAPEIRIELLLDTQVKLSWPNADADFVLEETDQLPPQSQWQPVLQTPSVIDGQFSIILSDSSDTRYFRLATHTGGTLPPDPAQIAPRVSTAVATTVGDAIRFLYSGANPIQTGVTNGTIELHRAAVLRGRVKNRDNSSLPGATISILNHPEFGQTLSRADGMFDLAVNGGGPLTLKYEKAGYISVQRQVIVPWQDYVVAEDVVMIQVDSIVTSIAFGSNAPVQVAQGSVQRDADGIRQATLLFAPGTSADLVLPNGTILPVSTLNVRATEFTVGTNGPAAMPATLPPVSGYTYCVELSADEAVALGAGEVRFDRPVCFYLENFLNFEVGDVVPTGYYDRRRGVWVGSQNGTVLKFLSVKNGAAELDITGDGLADDASALAALGISDPERRTLALRYAPGQTLWRVCLTHFSIVDCNWPYPPPPDAKEPDQPQANNQTQDDACEDNQASIIEIQNQILGERVDVVGTPFSLNYRSDRVAGRQSGSTLNIQLSGPTIPPSLKGIDLEISLAGRSFFQDYAPTTNSSVEFAWDHKDAYGRTLQGFQSATVRIGYLYGGYYWKGPRTDTSAFASYGFVSTPINGRKAVILSESYTTPIGQFDARGIGLGAWTLNVHHLYDPSRPLLYMGDGSRRSDSTLGSSIIDTVAGGGTSRSDEIKATERYLGNVQKVVLGADGATYIAAVDLKTYIYKIDAEGLITRFAGGGGLIPPYPDGIAATNVELGGVMDMGLGSDGSLLLGTRTKLFQGKFFSQILRVAPDGTLSVIAGGWDGCVTGALGDNGPATGACLDGLGLAAAPDGSVYFADTYHGRVRRVGTDGVITTVAGGGVGDDGGPASQARLSPVALAVAADGVLYILDSGVSGRVRRVGLDGIISTVAGGGTQVRNGVSATQTILVSPIAFAVGPDRILYIAEDRSFGGVQQVLIRKVSPDDIITVFAGLGPRGFSGDGGPALKAQISPRGLAVSSNGILFVADGENGRIRRIHQVLPGLSEGNLAIPSRDARELFIFSGAGQHLLTLDALTGATRYKFDYDGADRLRTVTDGDGNVTTVEHDGLGNPTAIVGPFGQRTSLSADANGYLASISNPAGETIRLAYTPEGLLTNFTNARNQPANYQYDLSGRLIRDEDPAGGSKALSRSETTGAFTVAVATAEQRTYVYGVATLASGARQNTVTYPTGLEKLQVQNPDGSKTNLPPTGTRTITLLGPDPRWGMLSPLTTTQIVSTPGRLTSATIFARTVSLADPNDPLSLSNLTETLTVNDRAYINTYLSATRTTTLTTPAGRRAAIGFDTQRRVVHIQVPGLSEGTFTYDTRGRLVNESWGTGSETRTTTAAYNSSGYLESLTDSLGRTFEFSYDAAGRLKMRTQPDAGTIRFGYDADGNLTSLTPAGRPSHTFAYSPVNLTTLYSPPAVAGGASQTLYAYSSDRDLTQITSPDGQTIQLDYAAGGSCHCDRISAETLARGTISYGYDALTGALTNIAAPGGIGLSFTYDGELLNRAAWSGLVTGMVACVYDHSFRITTNRVNGADAIGFQYDADSLLVQAGALSLTRDPQNGLLTGGSLSNVSDARAYNSFAELTNYSATYRGTPLYSASYFRDKMGRVISKTEIISGTTSFFTYAYNQADRLTNVTKNGAPIASYAYDDNGNRLNRTTQNDAETGVYDDQDRLLAYGTSTFSYNANGDLTRRTTGDQVTSYQYDELGNLLHVLLPDGTQIDYLIDGRNRRIGKKVNGVLAQGFLYQSRLKIIAELDANNHVLSRFVYASRDNVPDYILKGGATYRIITDHLGSPRLIIDTDTGSIAQRLDYDEFGRVLLDTNPGFQPFGFAGGIYDLHTRLSRFGARDYDPESGRWTAKDPAGFDRPTTTVSLGTRRAFDMNLYAYCHNNPVNLRDPLGAQDDEVTQIKRMIGPDPEKPLESALKFVKRRAEQLTKRLEAAAERAAKAAADWAKPPGEGCLFIYFDPRITNPEIFQDDENPQPEKTFI